MKGVSLMGSDGNQEFGKLRSLLWPIHNFELKKFLPMSFLMFFILFVYAAVRDLKDTFVQKYAVFGGTEMISALKLWFVFPSALIITMVFSSLLSKFGMKKTFYIVSSFFAAFFFIFAWFLFPNVSKIHMTAETMTALRASWPGFFFYIIPCLGNWSYTMFFIIAETWGTLAVGSLFWYFANQITKKTEVKRFYALYPLIGNIGVYFSGLVIEKMAGVKGAEFDKNVKILVTIAALFCVITMLVYHYIHSAVLTDPKLYNPSEIKPKKKKAKVGFLEAFRILASSKYLLLIFMLPISYGIGMNLFEGVFKAHMRAVTSGANELTATMGRLSQFTAIATVILTFISVTTIRKFSWRTNALITPIALLLLGLGFFGLMFYKNSGGTQFLGMGVPALALGVGLLVDAVSKGIKYCLFDTTKSMSFRPLDPDTQAQGQGAVEVLGGRGGKAGGAAITYLLLNVISVGSKLLEHTNTLFILFVIILLAWIFSVIKLSVLYEEKQKQA